VTLKVFRKAASVIIKLFQKPALTRTLGKIYQLQRRTAGTERVMRLEEQSLELAMFFGFLLGSRVSCATATCTASSQRLDWKIACQQK
jgi:hypothetical protein